VLQFVVLVHWRKAWRLFMRKDELPAAIRLGQSAAHLSLAATTCGILVTTPRLISKYVVPRDELGYIGVVFVCSTLIGMFFNVAYYRLASASRTSDPIVALRTFLVEGVAYGAVFVAGFRLSAPLVARLYSIRGDGFGDVFLHYGSAFVLFYFVMSLANLLKTSSTKLLESASYTCAATALACSALLTHSLMVGIIAASAVLFLFVVLGVQRVRRLVRA